MNISYSEESNKITFSGQQNSLSKCKGKVRDHKLLVFLMGFIIVAVVIGVTVGIITSGATVKSKVVSKNEMNDEYRLPQSVIPSHYVLEVQPYLIPYDFRFNGSVKILVKCVEKTNTVVFHSKDLSFNAGDIRIQRIRDGSILVINNITFSETDDFVTLHFLEDLTIDHDYLITIKYTGKISNGVTGLYISRFLDDENVLHYVASTQFQPVHAREAFPCFDEPALKATFDIIIVRWKNMTSLSNMPKITTEIRGKDWEADIYNTTMKMSTYLVAFIIGKYIGKSDGKVAIWTPMGIHKSSDYALNISLKLLPFYENLFGIPYNAPKLDMATITRHIGSGMENWGLIIYKDQFLSLEPNAQKQRKEEVFVTVAHEIAHQWFGNLVTLKWWSGIWLNEGLATYMESIATKTFNPNWIKIDNILYTISTEMFINDCKLPLEKTSIVWKNITDKRSVLSDKTFDTLTYNKGASIVQMVHRILGDELFWKFVRTYLKENAYGNVEESDFWRYANQALPKTRNVNIDMAKLASWSHQLGFVIVSVERNYLENTANLTQQSCRTDKIHISNLWYIPISFRTNENIGLKLQSTWSSQKSEVLRNMPSQDDWILFNDITVASVIVNYDVKNWKLLAAQLKKNHSVFTPEQRFKLLLDANYLYEYSSIDIHTLLDLSVYLHNETALFMFVRFIIQFLMNNLSLMKADPHFKEWKEYVIHVLGPLYDRIEKDNVTASDTQDIDVKGIRYVLCNFWYAPCVKDALKRFKVWKAEGNNQTAWKNFFSIYCTKPSNVTLTINFNKVNKLITKIKLRMARLESLDILCIAARESNNNSQYLYNLYMETKDTYIKSALLCSWNSSFITKVLDVYRKESIDEFFFAMSMLADNEKHWTMLFDYVEEQFKEHINNSTISNKMSTFLKMFELTPVYLEKALEITRKYLPNMNESSKSQLKEDIKRYEENIPQMRTEVSKIAKWLKGRPWTM